MKDIHFKCSGFSCDMMQQGLIQLSFARQLTHQKDKIYLFSSLSLCVYSYMYTHTHKIWTRKIDQNEKQHWKHWGFFPEALWWISILGNRAKMLLFSFSISLLPFSSFHLSPLFSALLYCSYNEKKLFSWWSIDVCDLMVRK